MLSIIPIWEESSKIILQTTVYMESNQCLTIFFSLTHKISFHNLILFTVFCSLLNHQPLSYSIMKIITSYSSTSYVNVVNHWTFLATSCFLDMCSAITVFDNVEYNSVYEESYCTYYLGSLLFFSATWRTFNDV